MKLYVVSSYPTKGCGVSKYTQELLDTLKQNNIDIISRRIFFYNRKTDIFLWFKFFFEILIIRPDIVHVQYTPTICGPILPLFSVFLKLSSIRTKLILTAHEKPTAYLHHLKYPILRKIFALYEKLTFKSCDKVLVHTEESKYEIINRYNVNSNRIEIVPHAVMTTCVVSPVQIKNTMNKYKLNNDMKIVTYFGFIRPTKGIDYLIDAFSEVLKKRDDVTLLIAGKAPKVWSEYLTKLKNMVRSNNIEEYVKFTGYIPDEYMPPLFSISKIIVLPYTKVTQSGVLHQAIAYGKPVVVADVDGISKMVKKYNVGYIVPPRDSKAIADAILNMLDHQEEMEMFRKNELKVAEELSQRNIAKRYIDFYNALAKERHIVKNHFDRG
jgi:glycosyltransferase involved in cell wall biosynthesis